ncbi:hypothetical protein P43SY_004262 [Pythium insidiosum]|uniref:Ubiquitin-like domain-containing protein n=1 Tax=Pythium insidiosum TaxID=114742 RepID=A0AAD5LXY8_PYTIN|nr:hypothetical protein P43SY_004262 [Pythium insidiosum]
MLYHARILPNDSVKLLAEVSTAPTVTAEPAEDQSVEVPEGHLRIRLRTGEQIRPAYFKATQVVDDFTSMGMLLIHDRTMGEYGIEEDGVIHAVVTDSDGGVAAAVPVAGTPAAVAVTAGAVASLSSRFLERLTLRVE